MTSEQLKYLILLQNYRSFNTAAEAANISFQAYARAIHRLETELDLQLVISTPSGTELTDVGARVANSASVFLNDIQSLQNEKSTASNKFRFQNIIIPTDIKTSTPLKPLILKIRKKYPLLELDYVNFTSMLDSIKCGEAPFGVTSQICMDGFWFKDLPPEFNYKVLGSWEITGYVSSNNKLLNPKQHHQYIHELDGLPLAISQNEHRESYKCIFPNSSFILEPDLDVILDLVKNNNYLSFLSKPDLKKYRQLYNIRELDLKTDMRHTLWIIYKSDYDFNNDEKELLESFCQIF